MTMKTERRFHESRVALEQRGEGQSPKIVGYAAVFYRAEDPKTEYRLFDDMVERIMPGAFDRAVREDDVRALKNHNANLLLGRTKSGTLRLSVDKVGLRYEIDPPDTQAARDLLDEMRRGDLDGSSFGFYVLRQEVRIVKEADTELWIREIHEVELIDVSPVTFPAYEATSSEVRSQAPVQELRERLERERAAGQAARQAARAKAVAARARAVSLED